MNPAPMPSAMEYVNGITTIVRNAGSAMLKSEKSISLTWLINSAPTTTSAGAAASTGTTRYSGVKNTAPMNNTPVTTFASPVRAPSAIPAADSTNTVFELAEANPPAAPASPSTNSALPTFDNWPSLSRRPASLASPVIVPIASKKSARTSVNTRSVTVISGSLLHAPNETSPISERFGTPTTLSGSAG